MAEHEQPIIIKKKKHGGHGGHHGGAWKVAYADFVTAMMAFFMVMWLVSAASEEQKSAITEYFEDPGIFKFLTGPGSPVDLKQKRPKAGTSNGNQNPLGEIGGEGSPTDSAKQVVIEIKQDSTRIADLENQIKKQLEEMSEKRPELKNLMSSLKIEVTEDGLRIEMVESKESVFFEVGSSRLTKEAYSLLGELGREIGKMPNYVEIEGHTDSRGYASRNGYTNWELSADRANSARKVLEGSGMWQGQIVSVTGFADRQLMEPENPFSVSNRRVSILVRFQHSKPGIDRPKAKPANEVIGATDKKTDSE